MKKIIAILFPLLLSLSGLAQERINSRDRVKYVEVPQENVLMVIVNQPHCPIKIEDPSLYLRIDKFQTIQRYRVRNISAKPIATFTVTSWSMGGTGGTLPVGLNSPTRLMKPGEVIDSMNTHANVEIVPLSEEIREQLKQNLQFNLDNKLRQVYFLMVDQVFFADGSVYRDKASTTSLGEFLNEHSCDSNK
jgi:hypothetical protein